MSFHNWAYGGDQADNGYDKDLLPQRELHKDHPLHPDRRMGRVGHNLTTQFNPANGKCGTDGQLRGKPEQCTYLNCRTIEVGDVFGMMAIPRFSLFKGVWWWLRQPVHGLVLDIGLRGCAMSVNPPIPNPEYDPDLPPSQENPPTICPEVADDAMNIVIVEDFDAGQGFGPDCEPIKECYYPSGYVCTPENKPIYFDQNDMLSIKIKALPEDLDPVEALKCLDLVIGANTEWLCKGGAGGTKAEGIMDFGPNQPTRIV